MLSTYLQALLADPEGCTRAESVSDPGTGDLIVRLPPLDVERVYAKEQQLIDLVAQERLAGRRVLVTPPTLARATSPADWGHCSPCNGSASP